MKRFFKMLLLVFFLIIIFIYVLVIEKIPEKIILFEGENFSFKTLYGIKINKKDSDTIETISHSEEKVSDKVGKTNLEVNLFNSLLLKEVEVDVIPKTKVIPIRKYCRSKIIYKWSISSAVCQK